MKLYFNRQVAAILIVAVAAAGLSGCSGAGINQESQGTLLGGALGGLAGYGLGTATGSTAGKVLLTLGGTLLGGYLGSRVGRRLDERDRLAMADTTQHTLETKPSGTPMTWQNPDSGHSGTVVARSVYRNNKGQNCRDFTQSFDVDGKVQNVTGAACRQPNGAWEIVR
ncbi:MAG: RT0821/Lpp0805 family surface protein [Nitrospinota bacterium]